MGDLAALIYSALAAVITVFHVALVLGAPRGALTQGGRVRGRLDRIGRVMAGISAVLIVSMALAILGVRGIGPGSDWPGVVVWLALLITCLTTIANLATPSSSERLLWGPVTVLMLICSVLAVLA